MGAGQSFFAFGIMPWLFFESPEAEDVRCDLDSSREDLFKVERGAFDFYVEVFILRLPSIPPRMLRRSFIALLLWGLVPAMR